MSSDDQEKFLREAAQSVKKNAYFMQKAMVSGVPTPLQRLRYQQGADGTGTPPRRTRTTCARPCGTRQRCWGSFGRPTFRPRSITSSTCRSSTSSRTWRCGCAAACGRAPRSRAHRRPGASAPPQRPQASAAARALHPPAEVSVPTASSRLRGAAAGDAAHAPATPAPRPWRKPSPPPSPTPARPRPSLPPKAFFADEHAKGRTYSELYELVQHAGNVLPRL
jgi:hypothetical protein